MNFFETEIGRIMSYTIHEHNGGIGGLINYIKFIEREVERDAPNKEQIKEYLQSMMDHQERCKEAMDYAYTRLRELEEKKK